jgi:hypothetical protein
LSLKLKYIKKQLFCIFSLVYILLRPNGSFLLFTVGLKMTHSQVLASAYGSKEAMPMLRYNG